MIHFHPKKIKRSGFFFAIFLILLAVNLVGSIWHARLDLTDENRYTLSEGTKTMLRKLESPVEITIYLKGDFPSGFKNLSKGTDDLLREFREVAGNKIRYRFVSPNEPSLQSEITIGDSLTQAGLIPINLTAQVKQGQQQQLVYPYARVSVDTLSVPVELYKGKTPIASFSELNDAETQLEFQLANAIFRVTHVQRPSIAYAIGNGEPMDYQVYDMVEKTINPNYNLSLVNLQTQPFIDPGFKALLIVKPSAPFSDFEKLKIDQYVMNGGKVLFFVDVLEAEMDSLQIKNQVLAYDRNLNLNDMFFKYGARVNSNLLMDLQCDYLPFDISGNGQFEFLPWNYFPVLESPENHPINKNLGFVSGKFVNTIDTVSTEGISKTVLLRSSVNAKILPSPSLISGSENSTAPEDEKFRVQHQPVAVLLEGKFNSVFKNRLSASFSDSLSSINMPFKPACIKPNAMLVVSDGDMVLNAVVKGNEPLPMGMNPFTYGSQREFPFANRDFLINALDYMVNENGLSSAKNKNFKLYLLDTKKLKQDDLYWQCLNLFFPVVAIGLISILFYGLRKRKYSRKHNS
jgi:gliding-associated putative ABC transporter substrate-binding component GldG